MAQVCPLLNSIIKGGAVMSHKRFWNLAGLICLTLGLTACQSGSTGLDITSTSTAYTYKFEENGCKTDEHSFSSKADYCNGLKNEDLNHGCAYSIRQDAYNVNCTGTNATVDNIKAAGEISGNAKIELNYTYKFSVNDCSTGEHTFDSKNAYCAALTDENLNRNCAQAERQDFHTKNCGDISTTQVATASVESRFSYKFENNGCSTGEHFFNSKSDYCASLKDDDLNRQCAPLERDQAARIGCARNDLEMGSDGTLTSAELPSPSNCTLKIIGADGVTTIQAESAEALTRNFQDAKNASSFCRTL